MAKKYELSDSKWERIEHLFSKAQTGRPSKSDNKIMFNVILWLARSGSAWEDIPSRYPPNQRVYGRFCKWHKAKKILNNFVNSRPLQIQETYPFNIVNISIVLSLSRVNKETTQQLKQCYCFRKSSTIVLCPDTLYYNSLFSARSICTRVRSLAERSAESGRFGNPIP